MQIADRWHLLSNMRDVLERVLHQRSVALRELFKGPSPASPAGSASVETPAPSIDSTAVPLADGHLARKDRFNEVRRLQGEGHSLRSIAVSMHRHHRTVERHVRSDASPDWGPGRRRPSGLDRFADHIVRRLREGCRNTRQNLRELQAMGYRGGRTALRVYVRRVESESGTARPAIPPTIAPRIDVPSARRLAVSAVRRPDGRSAEDRRCLKILGGDDGETGEAIELAGKFAALIRGRLPGELTDWLARAEGSSVAGLRSFARSLRQDEPAVRAGVTVEWSNGQVEGQVDRLKVIKRSMYGRGSTCSKPGSFMPCECEVADPGERDVADLTCLGIFGYLSTIRGRESVWTRARFVRMDVGHHEPRGRTTIPKPFTSGDRRR